MRGCFVRVLLCSLIFTSPYRTILAAEQTGQMSVTVSASGSDATRSGSEWSKATFSYRAALTTTVQSDGEPSDMNIYDPEFGEKMAAAANASMARMQAALRGEFSDEEEPEIDNRYLFFMGQMECPATLSVEIEERMEGEYSDVGGMQPYTMTFSGKSDGTTMERNMLCIGSNSVLDIKDNILYRSTLGFPEVTGHYIFNETNRGNLQDDPQSRQNALPRIVSDYVFDTLRVAPASGYVKTTLTPTEPVVSRLGPFAEYEGTVDVEISWGIEVSE